jgi:hypothetical protein
LWLQKEIPGQNQISEDHQAEYGSGDICFSFIHPWFP